MSWPELKPGEVYYPESDGKPMAETDRHRDLMLDLIAAARYHFRHVPDVYVSGNLFVYFVEGDPTKSVAPDFFVIRGVPDKERRTFKIWEETRGPEVVVELTSRKAHRQDLGEKRGIYERIGVLEYFLFDPDDVRFQPQLRGFRLAGGALQPVAAAREADGTLVLASSVLGLELHGRGKILRLVDPRTGQAVPTPDDFIRLAEEERRRAEEERARAQDALAELARAREEIARLRARGPS
jgi:Uma2 family endonuclease